MSQHTHACQCCNSEFECEEKQNKRGQCIVTKAVAVNGSGPYCPMCYHAIMFLRHTVFRGVPADKAMRIVAMRIAEEAASAPEPTIKTVITGSLKT